MVRRLHGMMDNRDSSSGRTGFVFLPVFIHLQIIRRAFVFAKARPRRMIHLKFNTGEVFEFRS